MNRLLLDTHAIIWWDDDSKELGVEARRAIQGADAVFVSAASEWELSIKAALGKISIRRTIHEAIEDAGFAPLPVSFEHAKTVRGLKPIHGDPFGRILVATAIVEGLAVVSADVFLSKYPVDLLDARK